MDHKNVIEKLNQQLSEATEMYNQSEIDLEVAQDEAENAYKHKIEVHARHMIGETSSKEVQKADSDHEAALEKVKTITVNRDKSQKAIQILDAKVKETRSAYKSLLEQELVKKIPGAVSDMVKAFKAFEKANSALTDLQMEFRQKLGHDKASLCPTPLGELYSPKRRVDSFSLSQNWTSADAWIRQYSNLK